MNKLEVTVVISVWFLLWLHGALSEGCDSPQYIELGAKGTVHCDFQTEFDAVFWYNSTDTVFTEPILSYDQSGIGGRGYTSGEFDVHLSGSLVINEVGLVHEHNFTVAKFTSFNEAPTKFEVLVIVTVNPVPGYPVLDGCKYKECCTLEVPLKGELTCSVTKIRPKVNLVLKASNDLFSEQISFFDETYTVTTNGEIFNITLTSFYNVSSVSSLTVECGVFGPASNIFPDVRSGVGLFFVPETATKQTDDSSVPEGDRVAWVTILIVTEQIVLLFGFLFCIANCLKKSIYKVSLHNYGEQPLDPNFDSVNRFPVQESSLRYGNVVSSNITNRHCAMDTSNPNVVTKDTSQKGVHRRASPDRNISL